VGYRNRTLASLLLLALVVGAFLAGYGYGQGRAAAGADADSQGFALVRDLLRHIRYTYLVPQVDTTEVFHGAARGMLEALDDPYSRFMDAGAYKEFRTDLSGVFYGVGIFVELQDGRPVVLQPIPGTPAHREGLRPGDRILAVDGVATDRMSLEEVVSRIRGPSGTTVTLRLTRGDRTFQVPLVRTRITNVSVQGDQFLPDEIRAQLRDAGVAYIRVTRFEDPTAREFGKALDAAINAGARGLLLDLRSNVGGLLHVSVEVADRFVLPGEPIVHRLDRDGRRQTERASRRPKVSLPVVVLVNEYTASAGEIVAGALADHEIAPLVGVRTFGKGVIQSILALPGGTGATLTSGKYLTPDGHDIHGKGIPPTVAVGERLAGRTDAEIRQIEAAQFARALDLLKQRINRR
jgi:carboxyl-terminal processing protease